MTKLKFETEVATLKKFFETYCLDKHTDLHYKKISVIYQDTEFDISLTLCNECKKNIDYSFEKLQNCPHEIKPRCRKCPNPCYEKYEWKQVAKVMKYSAIKLSLSTIKSKVFKIFN
ncbi:hypothetical protein GCM10012288_20490 [Malaciobacter pacificus]|uniref:Putative nitrous oxide-regulated protein n=1 Tax=Malaciobacter pacificus TaxID=1080223 RepID=A0A5C2HB68_9BACT|nr:nitrous oxide-stimulated promoter family protein [Malaciobacter pacificus]QEP35609.1 putative nitrous oxide-regulated protein [Malaciobacter pacificus]GGD46128.1 hypothetical protein GCM10012288_20490 [Malaciobacter pacificus]